MTYRLPIGYDHSDLPAIYFARKQAQGTGLMLEKQGLRFCLRCCADKPQKGGRVIAGGLFQCAGHGRKAVAA